MSYIFGQADWFYGINRPVQAYQCPAGHTQINDPSGVKCIPPTPTTPSIPLTLTPPPLPGVIPLPLEEGAEVIYEEEEEEGPDETKIFYQNMVIVGGGIAILLSLMLAIKQIVKR